MKKQLSNIAKIAKTKLIHITEFVKIDKENITATNLEVFYSFKHGLNVQGEGTIEFINFKKAYEKLKDIDSIHFENEKCILTKGNVKLSFRSISLQDWVEIPDTPTKHIAQVNFDENFEKAKKFAGDDEFRPALKCVNYTTDKIVSTNAHYLFFKEHNQLVKEQFLVTPNAFFASGQYDVYKDEEYICLNNENESILYRISDEKYPNYESVIPEYSLNTSKFDKKELKANIELLLVTANNITHKIDLYPDKIEGVDPDTESYGVICINQNVIQGNPIDISFNGELMIDCLNAIDEEFVEIETIDYHRPIILNKCILLMPMIRNY